METSGITSDEARPDDAAIEAAVGAAARAAVDQTAEAADAGAQGAGVRPVDLARQERTVRGRLPAIEAVHERFVRHLAQALQQLTRREALVTAGEMAIRPYGSFIDELRKPTNVNVMALHPLRGNALLVCEPELVFAVVDALFGGAGKFTASLDGREFSATELRVIRRIVDAVRQAYEQSWEGVHPLSMSYQRSDMHPERVDIATAGEQAFCASFTVTLGALQAPLHLCIPYAALEPIRDVLQAKVRNDAAPVDQRWLDLLTQHLQATELTLVAELACTEATVEELLAFQPGDFIELDLQPRIQACVEGTPILQGRYGTAHGRYALEVDRLLHKGGADWLDRT